MHEMSIAQSLFEIIEEAARKNDLTRVTVVRMKIGEMQAIVPDALEFCFEVLSRGTRAEGAVLEMTVVPVAGSCRDCGREFEVEAFHFVCPGCGGTDVVLVGGEELCLEQLEGE